MAVVFQQLIKSYRHKAVYIHTGIQNILPCGKAKAAAGGVEDKYCGHIHSRSLQAAMKSTKKEENERCQTVKP